MAPNRPSTRDLIELLTGQSAPEVSGNTRTTTYQYDADQAMTKATRPSGAEISMDYDAAGRLAASTSPEGSTTFDYEESTGQLASATSDDNEQTAFTHDGPLTESIEQSGTANGAIDFTFDNDFRTSAITTPGGTTNLTFDQDSLLTAAGSMTLTRNPATGQLTATTLGATNSNLTYNPFGEPSSETTTHPTGSYQETYERDALGRITKRTELSQSGTTVYDYTYDQAGRLTQVERNGAPYRAYTFDANGNRLSATKQTPSGPETQTATFDAQDRQVTSGPYALTYNQNGELTEKTNTSTNESLTLTYKTSGDLASATTPSGTTFTYQYDAFGNRTAEVEDGNLKAAYLYAPGISGPVAKVNASGQEEARYIYATRRHVPDYLVVGSTTYRLITDQLGSVRFVVNASTGAIAQEITYDPFGEVTSDSNPGFQPFGFAGGLYEPETGLTHFGAREYDAELGRWTSSDPIGFAGGDTNLYGYVVQDPVNLVDPDGQSWQDVSDFAAGFGDKATLGGTNWVREKLGVNDVVNKCSGWYDAGGYTATAVTSALGAASVRAAYMEYNFVKAWGFGSYHSPITMEAYKRLLLEAQLKILRNAGVAAGYGVTREAAKEGAAGAPCGC